MSLQVARRCMQCSAVHCTAMRAMQRVLVPCNVQRPQPRLVRCAVRGFVKMSALVAKNPKGVCLGQIWNELGSARRNTREFGNLRGRQLVPTDRETWNELRLGTLSPTPVKEKASSQNRFEIALRAAC
jgi:hypothetical protein